MLPVAGFHSREDNSEAMSLLESRDWLVVEGWEVRFYDLFLKYKQEIINLFSFDNNISSKVMAIKHGKAGNIIIQTNNMQTLFYVLHHFIRTKTSPCLYAAMPLTSQVLRKGLKTSTSEYIVHTAIQPKTYICCRYATT